MASKKDGVLYIGVTNDLAKRVYEHKNKITKGFTTKYNVFNLVHYEYYSDIDDAIAREKTLKNWMRDWKIALIEEDNLDWRDLYTDII